MRKIKIFLASSEELKADREKFEIEIYRKCKSWFEKDVFLHLDIWEDLSTKFQMGGSQAEYNKIVQSSDLFVMLIWTKLGIYTEEEFENAVGHFQETKKPFIFTYFKKNDIEEESVGVFKEKLMSLDHYYTEYNDFNDLWNMFNKELSRLELDAFEKNKRSQASSSTVITGNQNFNIQNISNSEITINKK